MPNPCPYIYHTHPPTPLPLGPPRLSKGEWAALLTLTLLYLGASMLDEASEIAGKGFFLWLLAIWPVHPLSHVEPPNNPPHTEATHIKNDEGSGSLAAGRMWWSFPALLCDIVFLSWVYMSLVTMMKASLKGGRRVTKGDGFHE